MSSNIYWKSLRRAELEKLALTEAGRDHIAKLFREQTQEYVILHRELTVAEMIDALLQLEFGDHDHRMD